METRSVPTGLAKLPLAKALAEVEGIRGALASCGDPERLEAIAASLPRTLDGLAPELSLALAGLALALRRYGPTVPDGVDDQAPSVRVAWVRVALAVDPAASSADTLDEPSLLRVLDGWSLAEAADPYAITRRMATADDPRLRALLLARLDGAVADLALTSEQAFDCVATLTRPAQATTSADPKLRREAHEALMNPWAQKLSATANAERKRIVQAGLDDPDLTIVQICAHLAVQLELRAALVDRIDDPTVDDATREVLVRELGPVATRSDLEVALTLAQGDPLRFATAARELVLNAHRHGVFLDDALVGPALEAYDLDLGWTADELVRVTYIARSTLIDELGKGRASDLRWRRRAAILAASFGTGADRLLAELLTELAKLDPDTPDVLDTLDTLDIATALIAAAGASPEYDDEDALLLWLERLPEAVIPVLRVKGGPQSAVLLERLVTDPKCPERLREPARASLWALTDDQPGLARELARALGPWRGGLFDTRLRTHRDSTAADILTDAPWAPGLPEAPDPDPDVDPDPSHTIADRKALELLCETGEPRFLAEVTRLFRAVYTRTVQLALAGNFSIKRIELPELEQLIYRYGRHLIASGRAVRRWLSPAPETGRDLLMAIVTDWLGEQPQPALRVALLESAGRHEPRGHELRVLETFWRDGHKEVQRAALETLVAAGEGARGLELSLARLASSSDPRVARQALAAVASLDAEWAEPLVLAALAQPQMGVKQAAAAALAEIGTRRCVPVVLGWLGSHDNAELRRLLLAALDHAAGEASLAVLVDALASPGDRDAQAERRTRLLHEAISGRLTLAATLRLASSRRREHLALVDAALAGGVAVRDTSSAQLAEALHRARLRPAPTTPDPTRDLRVNGFSPAAALALASEADSPEHHEAILRALRSVLPEWLTWLDGQESPPIPAVALALEAATPYPSELIGRLLDLAETHRDALDPGLVTDFIERCVSGVEAKARALAVVRALPPCASVRGPRRYRLLATLGAVRSRADLDACLDACRIGPALVSDVHQLLTEALAIPNPRTRTEEPEPEALVTLREQVEAWHRKPPAEAAAWLSEVLRDRPLDLPRLPDSPSPTRARSPGPASADDRDALLDDLRSDDAERRELAAARLLDWPAARATWTEILDLVLAGTLAVPRGGHTKLAGQLRAWPREPARARAAEVFIPHLTRTQLRAFVPIWIDAWLDGSAGSDAHGEPILARVDQALLIPHARARAEAGDYALLRVMKPDGSLALAELIAFVAPRAPAEVEHLRPAKTEADNNNDHDSAALVDPLADLDLDGLMSLIRSDEGDMGLIVRAVHALAEDRERGADLLEPLALDRRPRVRSAALRALRKVAPRNRTLEVSARVLGIETRRDVILSLISSLGYGRHKASAPALLEYLTHRDTKVRDTTYEALRAWGPDIAPTLRRASGRARPDRRRIYEELIDELERD